MSNLAQQLAEQILQAFNATDYERIGTFVTDDFVDHGAPPGTPPGRESYVAILRFVGEVLQVRYEMHEYVAQGHLVAIRATAHGVHATDHLGFPATGKPYSMPNMHLYREENGLLAEHWGVRDEWGVLLQVGAITVPPLPVLVP